MGRLSLEERLRVVTLVSNGYSLSSIHRRLIQEGTSISIQALYNLMKKYSEKGIMVDLPRRSRQRRITQEMKRLIEGEMNKNDELTAPRIKSLLLEKWPELVVSIPTIKRVRQEMGWVCTRPHYCQLLRDVSVHSVLNVRTYDINNL